jgi:hypothetical protein
MASSLYPTHPLDVFAGSPCSDTSFPFTFSPFMTPPIQGNSYPFFSPANTGLDPAVAIMYHQQQLQQLAQQLPTPIYPAASLATPNSESSDSPGIHSPVPSGSFSHQIESKPSGKRSAKDSDGPRKKPKQDDADDDEEDREHKEAKPKSTRGSRWDGCLFRLHVDI